MSNRKSILNTFSKGYWKDSLKSLQPAGTWREAWAAVKQTDKESFFGLSNEGSTELKVGLSGDVRCLLHIEERDYFIVFIQRGTLSEIGIVYKLEDRYKKITDFTLDQCEFNDITYKVFGNCKELHIYFSSGNTYYTLNIDDPCCKFEVEPLMNCDSGSIIDTDIISGGILGNGSYKYTYQLVDDDGNDTNWFTVNNSTYIAEDDKVPGERTDKAIQLTFNINSDKYSVARIAVIKNVGNTGYEVIGTVGVSRGKNSFIHTGYEQTTGISLDVIKNRKDYYIRGKNLVQYQNRLILYNILPKFNLDWQKEANKLKIKYVNYVVPLEYSHLFQGLTPNEKYWFGIRFNYCDNTTSAVFVIPGLEAVGGNTSGCKDCDIPLWKKSDTSNREELYLTDVRDTSSLIRKYTVAKQITFSEVSTSGDILPKDDNVVPRSLEEDEDLDYILDCKLGGCEGDEDPPSDCPECLDSSKIEDRQDEILEEIKELETTYSTSLDNVKYITTGFTCKNEGDIYCNGDICYECMGDLHWSYINNGYHYNNSYTVGVTNPNNSTFDPKEYEPEIIYKEDGCTIDEIVPKKYSKGSFGMYETSNIYPESEASDCTPLYGDLAGKNIRLHVAPSRSKEPNFMSFTSGVKHREDTSIDESANSFAFMLGVELDEFTLPSNTPKPLDADNPYTIMIVPRSPNSTSVIGSGIIRSTFLGTVNGEAKAIPKNGLNSFEFFDANINPSATNNFRGGYTNNVPAYVVHSPDFDLYKPSLNADFCIFEQELYGTGQRLGQGAEGEKPDSMFLSQKNNLGTRQSININHSIPLEGNYECVKAMSQAPADSIVSKGSKFSNDLMNLDRESSVYMELDRDGFVPFSKDAYGSYGGGDLTQGNKLVNDGASDNSFIGDTVDHACPLHNNRAHDVTFVRDIPDQYGSPIAQVYVPLLHGKLGGLVGDSHVGSYDIRTTSFISDKTPKDLTKSDLGISDEHLSNLIDKLEIKLKIPSKKLTIKLPLVNKDLVFNTPTIEIRPFKGIIFILKLVIKPILKYIFGIIGFDKCGDIPESGDLCDQRNYAGGLRGNPTGYTLSPYKNFCVTDSYDGLCWKSLKSPVPSPANRGNKEIPDDSYRPHVLKTTIHHIQNSKVNLKHRQTGEIIVGEDGIAEVFNRRLKTLKLDTSLYEGLDWKKSYLERFYVAIDRPPAARVIGKVLANTIFTFGIGLGIIARSIFDLIDHIGSLYIDALTIGTNAYGLAFSVLVNAVMIAIGVGWILLWSRLDIDNKFFDKMFNLDSCRPDKKFADGSYGIKRGRLRGFEDNYFKYSLVYNDDTDEEKGYGMGVLYNTKQCQEPLNNFIYSSPQITTSEVDSWKTFKVNDYQELPSDNGNVKKIFRLGDNLFVHTTDMILDLLTGSRNISLDKGTLLLGSGNLFSRAVPIYGGVQEGYAGLLDPNASFVSAQGYVFPDRKSKKLYIFNGQNVKPISDIGLQGYFQQNFGIKLVEHFPKYKLVDTKGYNSVGYSIGIDNEHGRLLFTKIDYEPINMEDLTCEDGLIYLKNGGKVSLNDEKYFINRSFTLSYDLSSDYWISNHYYTPKLYAWDRFNMFSFNSEGFWKHNKDGDFGEYYGMKGDFVIDVVVNDQESRRPFQFINTLLDTESYILKGDRYVDTKSTFTSLIAHNRHQNSGEIQIINSNDLDIIERSSERIGSVISKFGFDGWTISDIRDRLVSQDNVQFIDPNCVSYDLINLNNISDEFKNNKLEDNYLVFRFIFSIFDNTKLFLKFLQTDVDLKFNK